MIDNPILCAYLAIAAPHHHNHNTTTTKFFDRQAGRNLKETRIDAHAKKYGQSKYKSFSPYSFPDPASSKLDV